MQLAIAITVLVLSIAVIATPGASSPGAVVQAPEHPVINPTPSAGP